MADLEKLEIQIRDKSSEAAPPLEALAKALTGLKAVGSVTGLQTTARGITALATAANSISNTSASKLNALIQSTQKLQSLANVKLSATLPNNLTKLAAGINAIPSTSTAKIAELANALAPLTTLGKSNLGPFVTQLGKLPDIFDKLDTSKFADTIQRLTTMLGPFAAEMAKISAGFDKLPTKIQRLITSTEKYNTTMSAAYKGTTKFNTSLINTGAALYVAQRIGDALGYLVEKSNAYQENLNLFTASMGQYTEEAMAYAEEVSEVMGIDVSAWIREQGIFMTLATGFGVAGDSAALMSKNLTQLGYDIASFYNLDVSEAMLKLQSGLSGKIICLVMGKLMSVICLIRGNSLVRFLTPPKPSDIIRLWGADEPETIPT